MDTFYPNVKRSGIELKIELDERIVNYVEQLIPTGLYGTTKKEVVKALLLENLSRKMSEGFIKPIPKPRKDEPKVKRRTYLDKATEFWHKVSR